MAKAVHIVGTEIMGEPFTLCRKYWVSQVTTTEDPEAVTCKRCANALRKRRLRQTIERKIKTPPLAEDGGSMDRL
jgi:hypothetical protein